MNEVEQHSRVNYLVRPRMIIGVLMLDGYRSLRVYVLIQCTSLDIGGWSPSRTRTYMQEQTGVFWVERMMAVETVLDGVCDARKPKGRSPRN